MAYHIDPVSNEPAHCYFAHGVCPFSKPEDHYGSISEAVRERIKSLNSFPLAPTA